ncbi:LexA family transcriptional regulator [Pseudomonas sp. TMW22090]|uniref:LexA family transcriptional regulator n=1 Tax=Pseudomonas sp. TMW22090 TaxID=2506434 RepID=UPI001F0D3102|nr:LexA family transcriptional regulator [Pseudomonas sp. TMW22090]
MSLDAENTRRNILGMTKWYELAKARMKERKITQEKLAEHLGITQGAIAHWFSGRREPDLETINKVLAYLQLPLLGVGYEPSSYVPGSPNEKDYALIPQFKARGSCGDGYLNDHVELTDGLVFKRDWLRRIGAKPENLYVIYADGDSMEPYIFQGDVVLFDTSETEPKDKQVYVIRRPDGGNSIKRLIQQLSGAWLIRSDSPDKAENPDEPVSDTSIHSMPILGRVIWRGGGVG